MIFVDTGYFLALAVESDALHHRALAWAGILQEPFLTTEYVIWEAMNGLSKPQHRMRAHHLVNRWRSATIADVVTASPELFESGMQLHANRSDKSWSLTDCISFVVMEQRQITRALTPDHHFEQAGYEALLRRDPD